MNQDRTPNRHSLPNYQNAIILREKLERYCLDPRHVSRPYGKSSGKDKARVFKAALGFEQADWELLKQRILKGLPYYEAILRNEDEYGKRYNVELPITGPNGNTVTVLTAWIIKTGKEYQSFVTAHCIGGQ